MYLQHFGFTSFPFSINAYGHALFLSEQYREANAHLYYCLQHPGGIFVLTGEVGTGKTTLARHFLHQQSDRVETAFIINPRIPSTQLIATICQELGIKVAKGSSIKAVIDALHRYLLKARREDKRVVILVDEAQHLSFDALEQLRLLTNLETSDSKLTQIILVGQEELATHLRHPSLRQFQQRVIGQYHLKRLTLKQTGSYIHHRLLCANGSPTLIPSSLHRIIFKRTNGIPRLINTLCDRALLGAYALGRKRVDRSVLKQAIAEMLVQPHLGTASPSVPEGSLLLPDTPPPSSWNTSPVDIVPPPGWNPNDGTTASKPSFFARITQKLIAFMRINRFTGFNLISRVALISALVVSGGWFVQHQNPSTTNSQLVSVPDGTANPLPDIVLTQRLSNTNPSGESLNDESPNTAQPQAEEAHNATAANNPSLAPPIKKPKIVLQPIPDAAITPIFPNIVNGVSPLDPVPASQPTIQPSVPDLPTPSTDAPQIEVSVAADLRDVPVSFDDSVAISSLAELPLGGTNYAEYTYLLRLWDIQAPPFDNNSIPCLDIAAYQLTCAHITADLDLLRAIDLPTVMQINQQNTSLAASEFLLQGIDDDYALLWRSGTNYRIPTATLTAEWQGSSHYFIQAPQDFRTAFRPQSTSKSISWLINALSQVDAKYALNASIDSYNEQLIRSVKTFQQQQGLKPDGIAGFRTVALLNRILFRPPSLETNLE